MRNLLRLLPDDVKVGLARQLAKPVVDAAWGVMPTKVKKIAEKPAVKKIIDSPEFNAAVDIAVGVVMTKALRYATAPKKNPQR